MKTKKDLYILRTFLDAVDAFKKGEIEWEGLCGIGYQAWKRLEDRTSKETLLFILSQLWAEDLEKGWQLREAFEEGKVEVEVKNAK